MDSEEVTWIARLRQGDMQAYRDLYDRHYVVLCRLANTWLHDPFLAETIVGDAIVHLWEIRRKLEITTSLRSYLVRAVRNRCLNYLQQESIRGEVGIEALGAEGNLVAYPLLSTDTTPLSSLLERELEQKIMEAIHSLPDETRHVFCQSRFEQKKNEEIAQSLGISVNTVKYHIKRALSILREKLDKYLFLLMLMN